MPTSLKDSPPIRRYNTVLSMRWVSRFLYLVYLAIALCVGVAASELNKIVDSFGDGKGSITKFIPAITNPRGEFPKKDRFTVLLIGQDYNHTKDGTIYTKGSRADTIMMMSVDLNEKSMRACSVPRDTYVTAPDGKSGKINAVFGRGGVDLLVQTLEQMFGVDIDYHVIIKPSAVRNIVDAVGGVEVETIDEMKYNDNWGGLHVDLPKGKQFIDGQQAEGFVRFREVNRYKAGRHGAMIPIHGVKSSKEEGDLRRTSRQQQLIQAMVHSATASRNLMRLDEVISTGFKQIDTDLSKYQLLALASLFRSGSKEQMASGTVPGKDDTSRGAYYFELDPIGSQAMVDWLIKRDDDAMKRVVRVEVYNCTKAKGLARKVADQLVALGYNAVAVGNRPEVKQTRINFFKASYLEVADRIKADLGTGITVKGTKAYIDVGADIKIQVGEDLAPADAASATPVASGT